MTNYLLLAAAAVSFAAPVLAAEPKSSEAAVASASAVSGVPAAREKRYCVIEENTGSRIPHKTCRTRGD